ncbi:unnamed protein product [Cylicocyclus nassatus]|uniref:Uncharacterized protein n=1 Tax=Cylicocyclus nassatus TaxID=53992 RepID=A0AA36HBK0_CYLNA|nr:unnamed protein product [Cylicocyclus nassatus]
MSDSSDSTSSFDLSLSPPSYSVQEDPSSGDLRSRLQQIWPDRPEFGRYSLDYEYMDYLKEKKRKRKRLAAGVSNTRAAIYSASDMILPCDRETTGESQLVRTSMLFSSTDKLKQVDDSQHWVATEDLLTLGGLLPTRSPTLVPSEILRSSCSKIHETGVLHSGHSQSTEVTARSFRSEIEDEIKRSGGIFHFAGRSSEEEVLALLQRYPFIVFNPEDSENNVEVALKVGEKGRVFLVEILKVEGDGMIWRLLGTTFSLGFKSLEDMALFYRRFPAAVE